jgi:membrane protease subunit HflK
MKFLARRLWIVLPVLVLIGLAGLGWHAIAPGERGVVRRFGRLVSPSWEPGLHPGWPPWIDRVDRVRTDEVRRLTVGLAGVAGPDEEPSAGEFLTGDLNLLRIRATVQYRIAQPAVFVTRSNAIEPVLNRLTEASLTRALARTNVDSVLKAERRTVIRDVIDDLERRVEQLGLGVEILGMNLTDARPPSEVEAEFAAAQAAESDRARQINDARSYSATTATSSKARAETAIEKARADAVNRLTRARGEAARFLALQAEVGSDQDRPLAFRRIYLESIRERLAQIRRKIVLAPGEPVDLTIYGESVPSR